MIEVEIDQHFSAPPQKVFDAVTDHKRSEEWQRGTRVSIERPGVPPPNGLGAVRKIRGGPLRDHLGALRFTPTPEGGTLLEYRIRYRLPLVGERSRRRPVVRQAARARDRRRDEAAAPTATPTQSPTPTPKPPATRSPTPVGNGRLPNPPPAARTGRLLDPFLPTMDAIFRPITGLATDLR